MTTAFAAFSEAGTLMCAAEQTMVRVDAETGRPVPIPDAYREPIRAFEGADLEEAR